MQTTSNTQLSKPDLDAVCEQMAEQGDFSGIYELLAEDRPRWERLDGKAALRRLQAAIRTAAKHSPEGACDQAFQTMFEFVTFVTLRLQQMAFSYMLEDDRAGENIPRLRTHLIQDVLPQLERIQVHLATIAQAWASTSRQWALTEQKRQAVKKAKVANVNGHANGNKVNGHKKPKHNGRLAAVEN